MDVAKQEFSQCLPEHVGPARGTLPDLEPLLRDQLLARCRQLTLAPGEALFTQGARHTSTYIIRDGLVRTYYTAASGREVTMAYWSRGDLVGGPNFLGRGYHVWSGAAIRPSRILAISGTDLRELARANPDISIWVTDALAFKMRWVSILLQLHGTEAVGPRLAKLLLMLAEIYGVPTSGVTEIKHRMSQSDLATLVGASRQWTNKTLKRFQALGLVSLQGQLIQILDREGLQALGNEAI